MRFTPWATRLVLTLSLSATAFLTACGGGGSGSTAQVRLLNATQSYAQLDLTVNDKTINSKVAYATVGDYGGVDTANTATRVLESSVGTSISATTPTLAGGTNYTYVSYGFAGAVRTSLLEESQAAADANKAKLVVLNLAPDAGALDIYVTATGDALDTATPLTSNLTGGAGSGYNLINSGTFRIRVTGYSKKGEDLRLDIPAVTFDSTSVNWLILTSTSGGVLVNGMHLVQKGAVKNYPNTLTRVRAVNALAGTPIVATTVNGNNILPASLPPNTSNYFSFTAGASTTNITVNSIPLNITSPTFAAGGDYTLLIWGTASAPQLSVLSDDNRLPTVSGNVKMRLINGLSVPGTVATLNVDYQSQANNVLPGTSSTPANISSSTGSVVTVNSPLQSDALYNPSAGTSSGLTPLTANGVYTIFVMGDPAAPKGKFSKDR
ncbi:DUF4397 domain-containing protein [Roseateles puraquae]|jgi:CheY-specific phosphatase CheX|uniref:DUF4397 domain-containing protein n=1 Tax=Roseateles puraquae TaxID=431059 RepID=A0A254N2J2_9BURK|nr:DUF4397 domain-containing protein [Roseateles puraquae]MDG0856313.1 DUF4397 domain-containing protein [Roseateles puraquae]OWR01974.1 hypothetical protein CDO81_21835 [Roseateles puraquae]